MNILKKMFCMHKWISHDKRKMERFVRERYSMKEWEKVEDYTKEVLICEKCGKIKQIEY